jgi:hypothetical protein
VSLVSFGLLIVFRRNATFRLLIQGRTIMNAAVSSVTPSVEEYLDLGLRDQWHPVLASWEVAANPVGITRLGENIVVWRDDQGQVHALEDRCPHRGARLSLGWNLGNRVACWYHGVEFAMMVWSKMYQQYMIAQ